MLVITLFYLRVSPKVDAQNSGSFNVSADVATYIDEQKQVLEDTIKHHKL